jgi:hypothetical protein
MTWYESGCVSICVLKECLLMIDVDVDNRKLDMDRPQWKSSGSVDKCVQTEG